MLTCFTLFSSLPAGVGAGGGAGGRLQTAAGPPLLDHPSAAVDQFSPSQSSSQSSSSSTNLHNLHQRHLQQHHQNQHHHPHSRHLHVSTLNSVFAHEIQPSDSTSSTSASASAFLSSTSSQDANNNVDERKPTSPTRVRFDPSVGEYEDDDDDDKNNNNNIGYADCVVLRGKKQQLDSAPAGWSRREKRKSVVEEVHEATEGSCSGLSFLYGLCKRLCPSVGLLIRRSVTLELERVTTDSDLRRCCLLIGLMVDQ